ncbi:MAG: protein-methionine-sulfoxide reductase catalytic subunit MsrP [Chloroflexi bacterium]|nr:protein-methionine-sulfoxide reductase catalytic subunit MsrP [Chloroflexota bacterium]
MPDVERSEITPEAVYLNRRKFMIGIGALAASAALAGCDAAPEEGPTTRVPAPGVEATATGTFPADEFGEAATAFDTASSYNNYYEFTTSKEGVARLAYQFEAQPWAVEVGGLVRAPSAFPLEELVALGQEERVYRMRCVEGWSMVIPWIGFPLARLLERVEPTAEARYVRFETVFRPEQMVGQSRGGFDWPYVEGLRLDEAMHDLTILATGMYGKPLPVQNGAPVRLVVPWKYGFKSIKSLVRIDLVAEMPTTFWMALAPDEYGFYANVNPDVPHPRWTQAVERRIGESGRRETLLFNGYADRVASLYEGMDLVANY